MIQEIQCVVSPETAGTDHLLRKALAVKCQVKAEDITCWRIRKKSLDARGRDIKVNLWATVYVGENPSGAEDFRLDLRNVSSSDPVVVVGAGPAGLYAAIQLIELGLKPILIDRGRDVSSRKRDIARISREQVVDPESNYCFGEGGAGTFSDGKLYTRSNKRGDIGRVLHIFHHFGAKDEILYEAHPHIGTDALPEIIKNMRQTIIDCGGEVHFQTKLTDIVIHNEQCVGVVIADGSRIDARALILATGHSARDIYTLLHSKNILLEAKTFAMGVRVEHPQELIDGIQYHRRQRGEFLPAAAYSLVSQVDGRGVYSFCMCPGGYIVPSATADDEVVVNGMSSSRRHTAFANSGIVVEIRPEDIPNLYKKGDLSGLEFQQWLERESKLQAGNGQHAPAQRLTDFVNSKLSASLPQSSYTPGVVSSALHQWLPAHIGQRLQKGFVDFDKKMRGFLTSEAYVAGVESRTSSPVRIPREADSMQHPQVAGLFPCGEGAGYAGGIVSSAMDGENAAKMVAAYLLKGRGE
jgi:uncharacterized FAD-dependent dehydrogenase